jgi:hypothetical protein
MDVKECIEYGQQFQAYEFISAISTSETSEPNAPALSKT